jgi:hypothetical protein
MGEDSIGKRQSGGRQGEKKKKGKGNDNNE